MIVAGKINVMLEVLFSHWPSGAFEAAVMKITGPWDAAY